jgi:predicted nucleotidyltransferase
MVEIKKNPRSWSNKFWKKNDFNEILKEIIEPNNVDLSSIQLHNTLNQLFWNEDILKPEIRKMLLMNAKRFIEFSNLENLNYFDVILTGSLANYNYNENSDLDVHIILNFDQISENEEFVSDYLKMKKQLWEDKLPIQVKGHDVEMYFQSVSEEHRSSGTYSLLKNEWIKKPIKQVIDINSSAVQLKAANFMNAIDNLEQDMNNGNFLKKYDILKDKIKKCRSLGLNKRGGEFSVENLAFKILRNSGYLGKLFELKNDYLTQELTLNEYN